VLLAEQGEQRAARATTLATARRERLLGMLHPHPRRAR
jgi:hypothetical protein